MTPFVRRPITAQHCGGGSWRSHRYSSTPRNTNGSRPRARWRPSGSRITRRTGQLGEIVYVELPAVGDKISKDDPFGVVESVKAVSDIYAPLSGTVVEINEDLPESPEVVNEDPYGDGWLVKVKISDPTELDDLMDNEEYEELVGQEKE